MCGTPFPRNVAHPTFTVAHPRVVSANGMLWPWSPTNLPSASYG